uniref:Uncharacterized protein n=1 Tax=Anguilla anguilla TaxID=7936 RepID=A0A0E9X0P5_ANGAN
MADLGKPDSTLHTRQIQNKLRVTEKQGEREKERGRGRKRKKGKRDRMYVHLLHTLP